MKKYFDKGLANLSSKAATTASSLFGQHREDVSLTTVDVSTLTPQEAISQLQNHNGALIARVRQLQGATAENEECQKQISDLQSHIKELTAESSRKAEIYRQTQSRHKESLERLQLERDSLADLAKQSQPQAAEYHALQVELQEERAKLIMAGSESAAVPAEAEEEWRSLRTELQAQVQHMKQQAAVSQGSPTAVATAAASTRLLEAEAALEDSQRRATELSTKCDEMQEEIDVLHRQRTAALKAAATTSAAAEQAEAAHAEAVAPDDSGSAQAESAPPCMGGDGWGFEDDEWDDWGLEKTCVVGTAPGSGARQDAPPHDTVSPLLGDAGSADSAQAIADVRQAEASGMADHEHQSEHLGTLSPAHGVPESLDPESVLLFVRRMLHAEATSNSACELRRQLEGLLQMGTSERRQRSPSLGPVILVDDAVHGSPAPQPPPGQAHALQLVNQLTPPPKAGCVTVPNTLSNFARSQYNASPLSGATVNIDAGSNTQQERPGSPTALSFNPLFDASMPTPDPPGGAARPGTQAKRSASRDAPNALLAIPLLQWDTLEPEQLKAHLRVLHSVSAALECAKAQGGCDLEGPASAQPQMAVEPQAQQALCEAIRGVEQELAECLADIGTCLAEAALPRKLSGLGSETLQRVPSQVGTPHTPGSSPAASTSTFGLHSTLQELLRAHQGLLEACSGGGDVAQQCCADTKRLAAEVEGELQRLQELHLQQETEVAIQWREKQQVQSIAQVQMSTKEQELVVFQQQAEMYQAQLADLDAAYEQLADECQALRAAAQHTRGPAENPFWAAADNSQTGTPSAAAAAVQAPAHSMREDALVAVLASADTDGDLIQLDSKPGEAPRAGADMPDENEELAQAAAEGADGAFAERLAQLQQQVVGLEEQLEAVTGERDMMLTGITDIERATASRLQNAEQAHAELHAARASATAAMAEAEQARQACCEAVAEIAMLRGMIEEQQEVLEVGRQGAVRLESKVSELKAALQAAEAHAAAQAAADARADTDDTAAMKGSLAEAQQQLIDVTGQLDESLEAMQVLTEEHQAAQAASLEREEGLQTRATDAEAAMAALREQHASGLMQLQEEHAGSLEDVRAEARELVKKGTADLQQALKGAQAQLQVARSENASLLEERAKRLEEAKVKEADHVEQLSSAQEQMQTLQAAAEGHSSTALREIGRLQSEVEALQARVERMQKLNKDKKAELETLQAQHSSTRQAQQVAQSRADRALKDIAAMTAHAEASAAKLKQADIDCKELADVRAKVAKAASSAPGEPLTQQVEALCTAAQQATKLLREAKLLRTSADEGVALRGQVTELLAAASESAAAAQLLQGELAQAISDLAAAHDELQVCKAEVVRVQKQAKKDRVQFETEMSKHGSYLGSLPQSNLAAWPEAVQSLVQATVDAAVGEARVGLQADAMIALGEAETQRCALQQELQQATGRARELEASLRDSEINEQQLRRELQEQEAALQEQISALQLRLVRAAAAATHMHSSDDSLKKQLRDVEAHRDELQAESAALRQEVEEARMMELTGRQHAEREANGDRVLHPTDDIVTELAAHKTPGDGLKGHGLEQPPGWKCYLPKSTSGSDTEAVIDYWKQMYNEASTRLQRLQKEVSLVQMELDDERHVHELRSLADGARKLEIQELQAVQGRADLDIEYLKNVLLGFFESGDLPLNKQVLIVLDRLMLFTPQDRARIWKTEAKSQKVGWVSSLFS